MAFIGELNGRIIATAGLAPFEMPPTARLKNSRVARLMNMSVLPEYRRRGAARRLLKSIADYAAYCSEKIMLNASPMGELLYAFFRFERISGGYEFFPPPTPDCRIFSQCGIIYAVQRSNSRRSNPAQATAPIRASRGKIDDCSARPSTLPDEYRSPRRVLFTAGRLLMSFS
ncbi:MAG: GNAT family N-acetyltransferase [Eubacteriales bacterium]|nr:GNAT family N-acetyltransferase [Eubacteriales bacterium]